MDSLLDLLLVRAYEADRQRDAARLARLNALSRAWRPAATPAPRGRWSRLGSVWRLHTTQRRRDLPAG